LNCDVTCRDFILCDFSICDLSCDVTCRDFVLCDFSICDLIYSDLRCELICNDFNRRDLDAMTTTVVTLTLTYFPFNLL
jgi:hypothetical protein